MKLRGERSIIARSKTWNYDNDAYKPRIFKYRLEKRTRQMRSHRICDLL